MDAVFFLRLCWELAKVFPKTHFAFDQDLSKSTCGWPCPASTTLTAALVNLFWCNFLPTLRTVDRPSIDH